MQPREQMFPSNDRAQVFLDVVASRFLRKTKNPKKLTKQNEQTDQNKQQQNQPTKNSNTQTNQTENHFLLLNEKKATLV